MLVLSRKVGQSLLIGEVVVTPTRIGRDTVRIGIQAPFEMKIYRAELIGTNEEFLRPEERKHAGILSRLRNMPAEKRQEIIAAIVRTFCGKSEAIATATECERYTLTLTH